MRFKKKKLRKVFNPLILKVLVHLIQHLSYRLLTLRKLFDQPNPFLRLELTISKNNEKLGKLTIKT